MGPDLLLGHGPHSLGTEERGQTLDTC
jgi:hypothetical protein